MKLNKLAWCLGLLFAASTCFAQEDRSYTVFDVPGATTTHPVSINNAGDVAGWFCSSAYCDDANIRGFVRESNGNITTFDGIPTSINDAGAVTGYLGGPHCFVRDQEGNITVFDVFPWDVPPPYPHPVVDFAVAINNQGDIAGYLIPGPGADTHTGFVRDQQGGITTFEIPMGADPTSINGRGDITGHTSPHYSGGDGFVRDRNGDVTVFDVPGAGCPGPHAFAASINNGGDVAGYFSDAQHCQYHGFVRKRDGSITVFDPAPDADTTIASINEKDDVVGGFNDVYGSHQFLRDHKGNITVFDGPNGLSAQSVSINNRDDVTGFVFDFQNGTLKVHGFVRSAH